MDNSPDQCVHHSAGGMHGVFLNIKHFRGARLFFRQVLGFSTHTDASLLPKENLCWFASTHRLASFGLGQKQPVSVSAAGTEATPYKRTLQCCST